MIAGHDAVTFDGRTGWLLVADAPSLQWGVGPYFLEVVARYRNHPPPDVAGNYRSVMPGDLSRPRAIAIDAQDRLYIVDFTARIQVYDADGNYLGHTWKTPDFSRCRR